MRPLLIWIATVAALSPVHATVGYGDQFAEYYPEIVNAQPVIEPGIPLEKEVVVSSPLRDRKATFVRSEGTKIPYDKSVGVITIESKNGPKQYLLLKKFRWAELKWINERLLYIDINIGHIAGIDAIFDAQDGKWLYRQSMSFETE
ncbi:MAG: hypothetical protein ABSD47_19490 [Candidatus Methylomirabilota bacterium]|jgi:hypothetical protein